MIKMLNISVPDVSFGSKWFKMHFGCFVFNSELNHLISPKHVGDITVSLCRLLSTVVHYRRPRINVEIKSEVL